MTHRRLALRVLRNLTRARLSGQADMIAVCEATLDGLDEPAGYRRRESVDARAESNRDRALKKEAGEHG